MNLMGKLCHYLTVDKDPHVASYKTTLDNSHLIPLFSFLVLEGL